MNKMESCEEELDETRRRMEGLLKEAMAIGNGVYATRNQIGLIIRGLMKERTASAAKTLNAGPSAGLLRKVESDGQLQKIESQKMEA